MNSLSVCAIVKNEAAHIKAMIDSVRSLSNDIIIVDTGSSDDTIKIAQHSGAKVFSYHWDNDFSAARNYSLSLASNPWILVLDADEQLCLSAPAEIAKLSCQTDCAYALRRIHYIRTPESFSFTAIGADDPACKLGATGFYTTSDFRLFPNIPSVAFSGLVHESAEDSMRAAGLNLHYTDIKILHYGHLAESENRRKKQEWYLSLALEKVSRDSDDWRNHFQAGIELQSLCRHTEAISYFRAAIDIHPQNASSWRHLGISLFQSGDPVEGLICLKNALALDSTGVFTWLTMASALTEVGHYDQAEDCYKVILTSDPENKIALAGLQDIRHKKQPG